MLLVLLRRLLPLRVGRCQIEMRLLEHFFHSLLIAAGLGLAFLHLLHDEQDQAQAESEEREDFRHVR